MSRRPRGYRSGPASAKPPKPPSSSGPGAHPAHPTAGQVEAVARVLLIQYDREYESAHLTWNDFTEPAGEILAALAPNPHGATCPGCGGRAICTAV